MVLVKICVHDLKNLEVQQYTEGSRRLSTGFGALWLRLVKNNRKPWKTHQG